jgi:amidase
MAEKGAIETAAAIARGETTARAEAEEAISRIEERDRTINAVVVRDFARALLAADEADARLARGERAPLLGVPMTVKEAFNVAGLPTTWGFEEHRGTIATQDAVAVARLKQAGAIILGKTNVPVACADHQAVNPVYGRTLHPLDPERTPGGSSGGGAAAVASGMVPLEVGSDVGGSIRVPAAFTGIWGHKPSTGALSMDGHCFPGTDQVAPPMWVIGPLARDPDDLALALDLLADLDLPRAAPRRPADLRLLVLSAHPFAPIATAIAEAVAGVGEAFARAGARVESDSPLLPDPSAEFDHYMAMLLATLGDRAAVEQQLGLAQWFAMLDDQARAISAWDALLSDYDAVIAPAFGVTAFRHDDSQATERIIDVNGEPTRYGLQLAFPMMAAHANLPATTVPVGTDADGLPIGVQVIARRWHDHDAIAIARMAQALMPG